MTGTKNWPTRCRTNQMVWSILQSELTKKDNPLPQKLKENILTLSLFIDNRILEVMTNPVPEKLKIIVDINLNLAAGLRSTPSNNDEQRTVAQVLPMPKRTPAETSYRI